MAIEIQQRYAAQVIRVGGYLSATVAGEMDAALSFEMEGRKTG